MKQIYNILNSPIPKCGFGRNLTSSECKKLRYFKIKCSEKWIVTRIYDSETHGILYFPSKQSGYDCANIYVSY